MPLLYILTIYYKGPFSRPKLFSVLLLIPAFLQSLLNEFYDMSDDEQIPEKDNTEHPLTGCMKYTWKIGAFKK